MARNLTRGCDGVMLWRRLPSGYDGVGVVETIVVALVIMAACNGIINTGNCQVRRPLHLRGYTPVWGGHVPKCWPARQVFPCCKASHADARWVSSISLRAFRLPPLLPPSSSPPPNPRTCLSISVLYIYFFGITFGIRASPCLLCLWWLCFCCATVNGTLAYVNLLCLFFILFCIACITLFYFILFYFYIYSYNQFICLRWVWSFFTKLCHRFTCEVQKDALEWLIS